EAIDDGRDSGGDGIRVADVEPERYRPATRGLDRTHRLVCGCRLLHVRDGDGRALAREADGDRATDPPRSAGHDRDLAGEPAHPSASCAARIPSTSPQPTHGSAGMMRFMSPASVLPGPTS